VTEVLLALAVLGTVLLVSLPLTTSAVDATTTMSAARYVEGKVMRARMEAVKRAANVALRFESIGDDHALTMYVDGNGNGVRTADIDRMIDRPVSAPERLGDTFGGVRFGILADVPDLDGVLDTREGVRLGTSGLLSLSPDGSATAGTLYIHGRRYQWAVRVLGATGRMRLFQFGPGSRTWRAR
jgi:hypothetical protein